MSHDLTSRASIWPSTYVYILIYQTRRGYERTSVQKENFLPYPPPPPGGQPPATQLLCPAGGFHGKSLYLRPTPYSRIKGVLSGSINLMPTPPPFPPLFPHTHFHPSRSLLKCLMAKKYLCSGKIHSHGRRINQLRVILSSEGKAHHPPPPSRLLAGQIQTSYDYLLYHIYYRPQKTKKTKKKNGSR